MAGGLYSTVWMVVPKTGTGKWVAIIATVPIAFLLLLYLYNTPLSIKVCVWVLYTVFDTNLTACRTPDAVASRLVQKVFHLLGISWTLQTRRRSEKRL